MNRLLILDIDGVMTNGTKTYGSDGKAVYKQFCDLDFTAIKLFWARDWNVCFLSSDIFNAGIAKERNIDFYCSRKEDGSIDKKSWLPVLKEKYKIDYIDMIYIGDDIMDLDIMQELVQLGGRAYCPMNAAPYLKRHFSCVPQEGGRGVVMYLYDILYEDNCDLREHCY